MTPREMLIKARPLIESGGQEFICNALLVANGQSLYGSNTATQRIRRLLAGVSTVQTWLCHIAKVPAAQAYDPALLREYRLRWIDHLLEHDPVFKETQA